MKIKLLFLSVVVLAVGVMNACKKDTFQETTGVCPEVVSTTPFNGATAIPLDQLIQATFNTDLDPATIVASAFKLEAGNGSGFFCGMDATNTQNCVTAAVVRGVTFVLVEINLLLNYWV